MSAGVRQRRFWPRLLWSLVYPCNEQRAEPTGVGLLLVALSFGVGLAAYNSGNNILFLALSLLMASLIVSGILSWANLRGIQLELRAPPRARAGCACEVAIIVRNTRRHVPAYDLGFELVARPVTEEAGPDVGFSPRPKSPGRLLRQVWRHGAPSAPSPNRTSVPMGGALQPAGERSLDWTWTPDRRGDWELSLSAVVSLFPFGFLRKRIARDLRVRVLVRPAPIELQWEGSALRPQAMGGARSAAVGVGPDLHSLRSYRHGDSTRLIHWKASARSRGWIVRQHADESAKGCWLEFDSGSWPEGAAFEKAVRLAACVAERLCAAGALAGWTLDGQEGRRYTRREDLDTLLDLFARVRAGGGGRAASPAWRGAEVVRFSPDGAEGVRAHAGTACIARA